MTMSPMPTRPWVSELMDVAGTAGTRVAPRHSGGHEPTGVPVAYIIRVASAVRLPVWGSGVSVPFFPTLNGPC